MSRVNFEWRKNLKYINENAIATYNLFNSCFLKNFPQLINFKIKDVIKNNVFFLGEIGRKYLWLY